MATKNDFLFREEYEAWLNNDAKINTPDSQACYVRQDKFENTGLMVFEIAANFMLNGEPSYAYSFLEIWKDIVEKSGIKNLKSYYAKVYEFFLRNETELMLSSKQQTIGESQLNIVRKKINNRLKKENKKLSQLDGMDSLINVLGENTFIKLAVESSYFFDAQEVKRAQAVFSVHMLKVCMMEC